MTTTSTKQPTSRRNFGAPYQFTWNITILLLLNLLAWGFWLFVVPRITLLDIQPNLHLESFTTLLLITLSFTVVLTLLLLRDFNLNAIDHRRKDKRPSFSLSINLSLRLLTLLFFLSLLLFSIGLCIWDAWQLHSLSLLITALLLAVFHPLICLSLLSFGHVVFKGSQNDDYTDLPNWRELWLNFFIPLWLFKLDEDAHEQYRLHGHWRIQIYFTQLYRRWQYFDFKRFISSLRWLWVLIIAVATYFCSKYIINAFKDVSSINLTIKDEPNAGSQTANIIIFILSMGVLYFIWLFRDQNARWQIENARKDVNLKDFQRISEWAAGLHLPEDKITRTTKTTEKKQEDDSQTDQISETSTETTDSREAFELPAISNNRTTLSRRDGAASLQIAAIYQMSAFLRGDFGAHFQRPAFQLLTSLYQGLGVDVLERFKKEVAYDVEDISRLSDYSEARKAIRPYQAGLSKWHQSNQTLTQQPIHVALDAVLLADHGRMLRQHHSDLNALSIPLTDAHRASLTQPLELFDLSLRSATLVGAKLTASQLQGADLTDAKLQGADLKLAQLQDTNLMHAQLQGAILQNAQLQGAILMEAGLQAANLRRAGLQAAILTLAKLQGADLRNARLQGADLIMTKLHGANLTNAILNDADLRHAELKGANLTDAKLQRADLREAELQGACLINFEKNSETQWAGVKIDDNTLFTIGKFDWGQEQRPLIVDLEQTTQLHEELRQAGVPLAKNAFPFDGRTLYEDGTLK